MLNRADELRMHFNARFNNGVTVDKLKELILHSSLPAANAAYHLLAEVLKACT